MRSLQKTILGVFILLWGMSFSAQANNVRYMRHAEESLASFLHLIQNAKKSISLTTFIFEPCHASTQVLLKALEQKARSGVKVRILLDYFLQNRKQAQALANYFSSQGMELRWYNTSLFSMNARSHIKLIVADGNAYISGGRNIADEYFSLYQGANFIDRDAYVRGASGTEAQLAFDRMWDSKWTSRSKSNGPSVRRWTEICETNEEGRVAQIQKHMQRKGSALMAAIPLRSCADTHFIADEPGAMIFDTHDASEAIALAERKKKHVTSEVVKFMRGTKKHLIFENWSMMPHPVLSYEFFDLRWKKIPVVVITNDNMDGPGILKYMEDSFNNRAARLRNKGSTSVKQLSMHGGLKDKWDLSPSDVEFRLHGKVGVRDGKDVMVSSFNIDHRSYTTNLESMVLVKNCPALADDLNVEFSNLVQVYKRDLKAGIPPNNNDNLLWTILGALGSSYF